MGLGQKCAEAFDGVEGGMLESLTALGSVSVYDCLGVFTGALIGRLGSFLLNHRHHFHTQAKCGPGHVHHSSPLTQQIKADDAGILHVLQPETVLHAVRFDLEQRLQAGPGGEVWSLTEVLLGLWSVWGPNVPRSLLFCSQCDQRPVMQRAFLLTVCGETTGLPRHW
ncbi:hypothetical protein XENOCAPTIV_030182 [Xenoophorus captivus]|uniref:Uncharacterized protein n=1 Tax=Xenoophorus captivus TaxID=1517983 RepID=A0ABV0S5Y1_9TELE